MNIIDVAREAGVSKSTVSRVLANSELVKPDTKEKVLNAIERLGFVPNTSAQQLAGKKNGVVGVITSETISDPFYGYFNDRLMKGFQKYGYDVIYAVAQNTKAGCDREISMLYGKVDAYVVVGSCALQKNVEKIVQMNMPVALFQTRVTLDGAMALQVDNEQGGYLAASELLSRGYQRIGYLHGSPDGSFWEGEERFSGFKKCMETAGCTIEKEFFGNRDYGNAYRLTKQIVESGIDALFCETDLMAYGVLQGLYEAKVAVPDRPRPSDGCPCGGLHQRSRCRKQDLERRGSDPLRSHHRMSEGPPRSERRRVLPYKLLPRAVEDRYHRPLLSETHR